MFDVLDDPAVRPEVAAAVRRAWAHIAATGEWWTGPERIAIAATARAAATDGRDGADDPHRGAEDPPDGGAPRPSGVPRLPAPAREAAARIAARPASVTERWVRAQVEALGLERYVELVGVVARTTAVDTLTRLLDAPPEPWPEPADGQPRRRRADDLRDGPAWVPMGRFRAPPIVLAAVPAEVEAQNDLSDVLYMPGAAMERLDAWRGPLHRAHLETVATTVSHANQCFY